MTKDRVFCRPRRLDDVGKLIKTDTENPTATSVEQHGIEVRIFRHLSRAHEKLMDIDGIDVDERDLTKRPLSLPKLDKKAHVDYLTRCLRNLSQGMCALDASRPWLVYWIVHALELMHVQLDQVLKRQVVDFLAKCQNPSGGFGGGPGQMSHLAPTYAAVNAIAILKDPYGYDMINREKLASWLNTLRLENGSFVMHEDGEDDVRGVYCALSCAKLTNVYTPALFKNSTEWVLRCQTYEGGFGAAPWMEAHGGYTFCAFAALVMMEKAKLCDLDLLLKWAANRQMIVEGGFQGRTNKLVDSCYSFWQGGVFPLLHELLAEDGHRESLSKENWMFNQLALQEYLLLCCQEHRGGIVDKPGKSRDCYHTCYALSGLAVSQRFKTRDCSDDQLLILGKEDNELAPNNPLFNVSTEAAKTTLEYFRRLEVPQISS